MAFCHLAPSGWCTAFLMKNTFDRPIIPHNEQARLAALHRYQLLGNPPAGAFNHIAAMAVRMFEVPIALVNFVAADTVYTTGAEGEMAAGTETPRGVSLCSLAVLQPEPLVFEDALQEPCLLTNPMVTDNFGLRFYAAAPIITPDGHQIGAVCLIDKSSRTFTDSEQKVLVGLAKIVMEEIEERYRPGQPFSALPA